ncbi:branched-chain amino acid ABC transporter permease [Solwaraspora sp. WMMD1047]|uniref:branched-chain amino acid ABC transporter permease n=1 Tax=Solwaraspora sp. WMMD1047 TaxID=3016102 RepID=UPI002415C7E8|nr:branched-chain amino acid ABC transporter permease [Solwaraspora sp. WMMD1047]MDG4830566.1 branched-chain amino acid ABC transporter permease [Solwaraspora sp. WMMD1047]
MTHWFDANLITMINGLAYGLLLYTLAVGLSLVFGMLNLLNLAHGTLFLGGAYVAAAMVAPDGAWLSWLLALTIALVVGAVAGLGLGMITRPLAKRGHMAEALLTLGVSLAGGSLLLWVFGADVRSVPAPAGLQGSIEIFGNPYPSYRLVLIGFGLLVAILAEVILERTMMGATVRAIVADADMVRALGVDTRRIVYGVLAAGSALAVVAGVIGGPVLGAGPGLDGHVLLIALVVVVVGGLGSARGALIGGLLIGQVQTLGTALAPAIAPFLIFGAMALILVVRPHGLLGRAGATT